MLRSVLTVVLTILAAAALAAPAYHPASQDRGIADAPTPRLSPTFDDEPPFCRRALHLRPATVARIPSIEVACRCFVPSPCP